VTRASWTIRPKGERDAEAVVALLAQVAREGTFIATEWPFELDARARAMRDALLNLRCVGWIALERHKLVGDLSVYDVDQAEPELGMIVDAAHRGRGIGRALLESAIAWAAPPMSFFMRRIPSAVLMSRPPESKHTPLPTSASFGCFGLPQWISSSRGARAAARPTAWMAGKFCASRSSPTHSSNSPPKSSACSRAISESCSGPMSSAGVFTRSRTSRTACAISSASFTRGEGSSCRSAAFRRALR